MTFSTITYVVEAGIARLTLNRPERLNSFTEEMHAEIRLALAALDADRSVRALVLSGAGRGFCAGQDLNDRSVAIGDSPPDIGVTIEKNYKPLVLRLQNLRVPTLCAVNGIAAGAGASLALRSAQASAPARRTRTMRSAGFTFGHWTARLVS